MKDGKELDLLTKNRIKELVNQDKRNHRSLAVELGVTLTMVQRMSRGSCVPTPQIIRLICSHYGVSSDWLLGLNEEAEAIISLTDKNRMILDAFGAFLLKRQKAETLRTLRGKSDE